MVQVVGPGMGEEGVPDFTMEDRSMVGISMAMQTFLVNWEVELKDLIARIEMWLEAE